VTPPLTGSPRSRGGGPVAENDRLNGVETVLQRLGRIREPLDDDVEHHIEQEALVGGTLLAPLALEAFQDRLDGQFRHLGRVDLLLDPPVFVVAPHPDHVRTG
jgi:hypothetical protein